MNWLNTHSLTVGTASVSYAVLLIALLVIVVGFVLAAKVSARIRSLGATSDQMDGSHTVTSRIVGNGLRFVSLAIALQVTGINIASVLAASAALAVGIGIAMQKVVENFVSGVILFTERSIREGDIVELDGRVAKIQHIGIRTTIGLTFDNDEIIFPNSILTQSTVKNLTLTDSECRLRVNVGVSYGADVDRAAQVLRDAATSIQWRHPAHDPDVFLIEFGSSSIDFEVSVWSRDVWARRKGQSELRKTLWRALRDNGIAIPFPQLDLHFPDGLPKAC